MHHRINQAAFMAWATAVAATGTLRARLEEARADQRGEISSTVIMIAVLAALALAVGAIITTKVTDKANSIPTT